MYMALINARELRPGKRLFKTFSPSAHFHFDPVIQNHRFPRGPEVGRLPSFPALLSCSVRDADAASRESRQLACNGFLSLLVYDYISCCGLDVVLELEERSETVRLET